MKAQFEKGLLRDFFYISLAQKCINCVTRGNDVVSSLTPLQEEKYTVRRREGRDEETMAVEDTLKPNVATEESNPNSVDHPIDRYHEEGDDAEEGEIVDESGKSAVPESHPLEHSWTLWFDNPSVKSKQTTWGSSLRSVFTFSTVEDFWRLVGSFFPSYSNSTIWVLFRFRFLRGKLSSLLLVC